MKFDGTCLPPFASGVVWSTSAWPMLVIGRKQHGHTPAWRFNRDLLVESSKGRLASGSTSARFSSRLRRPSLLSFSYSADALFMQARQKPFNPPEGVEPKNFLVAAFVSPHRVHFLSCITLFLKERRLLMFNGLFGIGRSYKKLPPHHNFTELANNIEELANALMDQSLGSFAREGYLRRRASGNGSLATI